MEMEITARIIMRLSMMEFPENTLASHLYKSSFDARVNLQYATAGVEISLT